MTIALAGYAAVVASLALGWQVYQWRASRRGSLDVDVAAYWRADDDITLFATFTNRNDNPYQRV
jgi:hypothetical protein